MNWVSFGILVVRLLLNVATWLQEQKWYQEGVRDANLKAELEQKNRVAKARAAGEQPAPPDGVPDPFDRDA